MKKFNYENYPNYGITRVSVYKYSYHLHTQLLSCLQVVSVVWYVPLFVSAINNNEMEDEKATTLQKFSANINLTCGDLCNTLFVIN